MVVIDLTVDSIDLTVDIADTVKDDTCPVCLDTKLLKRLTCKHGVCKPCWVQFTNPRCPICREPQAPPIRAHRESIRAPRAPSHPPIVIYNFQRRREGRRIERMARQRAIDDYHEYRTQELNSRFAVLQRAARLRGEPLDTTAALARIDADIDIEFRVPLVFSYA